MLRIGIGEHSYTLPYGFEEGVARMKRQGYSCMDYSDFADAKTELYRMTHMQFETHLQKQAAVCRQEGIVIHQTHGPWRYPPRDTTAGERAEMFELMTRAVEGTAVLGCKKMVVHPVMPFSINDEGHEKETYEINLDFTDRLCRVGREYDVVICLENMPMPLLSIAPVSKTLGIVKEINDDYLKVCLDTGHSIITKVPPAEAVRMIGKDYLQALHIHDNNGKHDVHVPPFSGVIDWEGFCDALREISFDGVMNLEVKSMENLPMELRGEEERGLYHKIEYLAKAVSIQK